MTMPHGLDALPHHTPSRIREALAGALEAWSAARGPGLVSVALFGSIARGEATDASDVDLVVVAEGLPRALSQRRRMLLAEYEPVRLARHLAPVEWNLVTKTPDEARVHSPLYLDMVEDAILLVDRDGFLAAVLGRLRARMRELGSRRIFLPDGSWYWDLHPGFRFGQELEL